VGAKKEEDGWCWDGEGDKIPDRYFAIKGNDKKGFRGFGAFEPIGKSKDNSEERSESGFLFKEKSVDWGVHGYVIERQSKWSSTYTLNAWVVGRHPNSDKLGEEKFFHNMADADGDVPLFSEGTGPIILPQVSDVAPRSFKQGGQEGVGLDRLCIDRYRNMANNVSRMDGSVENVKLMNLWKQKWHRGWKAPKHVPGF